MVPIYSFDKSRELVLFDQSTLLSPYNATRSSNFPTQNQMDLAYKLCHKVSPTPLATFSTTKPEQIIITAVSAV